MVGVFGIAVARDMLGIEGACYYGCRRGFEMLGMDESGSEYWPYCTASDPVALAMNGEKTLPLP